MQATSNRAPTAVLIALALTAMSAGRAMTLAWVHRAGDGGAGDPPAAWLMPLLGDGAVGLSALAIAYLLWRRPTPLVWGAALAWSGIAAFDAVAAFLVDVQSPWPEFFMLEIFGRPMFFAAAAMHVGIIWLLARPDARRWFFSLEQAQSSQV